MHTHSVTVKKQDRISPVKVRLTIEMPGQIAKDHATSAAQKLKNTAKVPGFRPGKVPLEVIRKKYRDEITQDVVSHLLESGLSEALKQTNLSPVSRPTVQLKELALESDAPFEFDAEFEVRPDFELKDYKGLKLEAQKLKVEDSEVDDQVKTLRERLGSLDPVNTDKVEKGQYAVVKVGMDVPGKTKDEPKEFTVEVGVEKLLPELDSAILSMKVGERKEVAVKFPKEYGDQELAGQDGTFDVELLDVKKMVLPEANDAFANQLKEGLTLLALRAEIRKDLETQKENNRKQELRQQVVERLSETNEMEVPPSMVAERMQGMKEMMEQQMKSRGQKFPEALNDEEEAALKQRAEFQVKTSLILSEVAKKEAIQVDQTRVDARVDEISKATNQSKESTMQALKSRGLLEQIMDEVLTDQVFDLLIQNASLKEIEPKSA